MNSYLLTTLSIIIILSFFEILVTKTQNGKVVKTVISLIITLILTIPIVSILKGEGIDESFVNVNLEYASHLDNLEKTAVESKIKFCLDQGGFVYKGVKAEFENSSDLIALKKIYIILDGGVIIEETERINMIKDAERLLKNVIDIGEVEIEIETD
ncbi:MAG: hypothetical protein IJA97_05490 [Clostridia bacterium]|nr:hypothetical protein [Clostridia bacterium]